MGTKSILSSNSGINLRCQSPYWHGLSINLRTCIATYCTTAFFKWTQGNTYLRTLKWHLPLPQETRMEGAVGWEGAGAWGGIIFLSFCLTDSPPFLSSKSTFCVRSNVSSAPLANRPNYCYTPLPFWGQTWVQDHSTSLSHAGWTVSQSSLLTDPAETSSSAARI